jgi:hypothetical protein
VNGNCTRFQGSISEELNGRPAKLR